MKSREGGDTSGGRLGRGRGRGQVGLRRRRPLARWVTPTVWPPGVPRGPWVRSARDSVSWARSSALPRGSARGRSLQPVRPNTRVSLCHGPAQPLSACLCASSPARRLQGGGVARGGPPGPKLHSPLASPAALPSFPNSLLLLLRCPRPGSPPRTPLPALCASASPQLPIRPPRSALGLPPALEQLSSLTCTHHPASYCHLLL